MSCNPPETIVRAYGVSRSGLFSASRAEGIHSIVFCIGTLSCRTLHAATDVCTRTSGVCVFLHLFWTVILVCGLLAGNGMSTTNVDCSLQEMQCPQEKTKKNAFRSPATIKVRFCQRYCLSRTRMSSSLSLSFAHLFLHHEVPMHTRFLALKTPRDRKSVV